MDSAMVYSVRQASASVPVQNTSMLDLILRIRIGQGYADVLRTKAPSGRILSSLYDRSSLETFSHSVCTLYMSMSAKLHDNVNLTIS